jgi:uncharacterized protein YkwD
MGARFSIILIGLAILLGWVSAKAGGKSGPGHARSLDEIKKTLTSILSLEDDKADEKTRALNRLKAYRYLAGVPYEDITLDEEYNAMCLAGLKLCAKLGKVEHTPKNPGLPEDEYKLAYKGTSRSNLTWGRMNLSEAVDGWMSDSDAGNIDRLGHRRWCLNPAMKKTGFARIGSFDAMYVVDRGRDPLPDFDFICWPARGYMPVDFFGARQAWSVTLHPKKYKAPAKDFAPKVYQADDLGGRQGEPLKLDFKNVNTTGFGIPNCVIFRPAGASIAPGQRYIVELPGIAPLAGGEPVTLRYEVEFVKWQ